MPAASPPPTAPPPGPARTGLALGLAGAGIALIALFTWLAYRAPPAALPPVDPVEVSALRLVREMNTGLPRDIGDGLVLERLDVEGRTIIMTLRSRGMTLAEAARDPARFQQVRQDEQARLLKLCAQSDVRRVLREGVVVTRRFLDRADQRFFDVSLAEADCQPGT